MPDVAFGNLLAICLIGLMAPLVLGFVPRLRIPSVVLEIAVGILVGPSVLGWVQVDLPVEILAIVGLAFLLLLAGLEIDLDQLRGRALGLAIAGFMISLAVGFAVGSVLHSIGLVGSASLLAVALSATSLGLIVPVLKDSGLSARPAGRTAISAASIADFAAIGLLSLLFSTSTGTTASKVVGLSAFAALMALAGLVSARAGRWQRLEAVVVRLQDTTAEVRVRASVVLLVAFVALASKFGLEIILGAFLAGAVIGLVDRDTSSHPAFRLKLEAIGYGFLVPVFFVSSGVRLDLSGLFAQSSALVRVPLFLLALLAARGLPSLLHLRALGPRSTAAVGLLQATSLPFLVTAAQIGQAAGLMDGVTAAALVCAGLISVLLFPTAALGLLRSERRPISAAKGGPRRLARRRVLDPM